MGVSWKDQIQHMLPINNADFGCLTLAQVFLFSKSMSSPCDHALSGFIVSSSDRFSSNFYTCLPTTPMGKYPFSDRSPGQVVINR
ncbi:hypothetical protein U9M48_015037 [Paspalum notatum var. saurae]|uniref:Uncharacterized protein n=1 Tax=Paspalum notatum var. saurae TaxID=547442 RepID=A0AAQ3WLG9_PASNO